MAEEKRPVVIDNDNPEWTAEDFANAKPVSDHPLLAKAFPKRRGRPAGQTKEQVTLRLDKDVLMHFRAGGPGWQSRLNEALRKTVS